MGYIVRLTTTVGRLDLPIGEAYETQQEASEVAAKVMEIDGAVSAEVIDLGGGSDE